MKVLAGNIQIVDVAIVEENGKFTYTYEFANGQVIVKKLSKKMKYGLMTLENGKYRVHHNQMKETSLMNKYHDIKDLYKDGEEIGVIQYY